MLKVMFWDKSICYVDNVAQTQLEAVMGTNKKFRLKHLGNPSGDMVIGSAIYRITKAMYTEYSYALPRSNAKQIEAPKPPEKTEEELQASRDKIAKMKQDFFNRRANKGGENATKRNDPEKTA